MKQGTGLGFTLLELIICISITLIITSIGIPSFQHFIQQNRSIVAITQLAGAVAFARTEAILLGKTISLCPRSTDSSCGKSWQPGINIFIDHNADGDLSEEDLLVQVIQPFATGSFIRWAAFGNKNYLSFSSMGYTLHQNGSFYYCPQSKDARYGRVLILNKQGRTRQGRDQNRNGIPETATGIDMTCE